MAYKITQECLACGVCMDECPIGAVKKVDVYVIDAKLCNNCGICDEVCPSEAIVIE